MISPILFRRLLALLAITAPTITTAQQLPFPYNPTHILTASNGSLAYIFTPQSPSSSTVQFLALDTSDTISASSPPLKTISATLPFPSSAVSSAFIPLLTANDTITVLAGDCTSSQLWRFEPSPYTNSQSMKGNGTWTQLQLSTDSSYSLSTAYLSAGLSFSPTASSGAADDMGVYIYGGMCPNTTSSTSSDTSSWTLDATYSNNMLTISPSEDFQTYSSALVPSRGPPIPEAGLTITGLPPTFANSSNPSSLLSQQQNFVLLGGHTAGAFINMSSVALFSLPESSWSFIGIDQPNSLTGELMSRATGTGSNAEIEPRSGHTAVLSADGTKIFVFGGWVGDVSTAADPQLAILELGQGYGGAGDWMWSAPSSVLNNPFSNGQGIYGHGAAMLPGGVMLIVGGRAINSTSSTNKKRTTTSGMSPQFLLFNTSSSAFISSYTNPSSPNSPLYPHSSSTSGALKTASQKAGLGAGLVLGFSALAGVVVVWLVYSRRLRQKRALRERELRELALGAERFHTADLGGAGVGGGAYPEMSIVEGKRSASWGSRQERRIGTDGNDFPWAPVLSENQAQWFGPERDEQAKERDRDSGVERTGLLVEIPSPTRGLRKSLYSRGPHGYGVPSSGRPPSVGGHSLSGSMGIHRIDEAEDESSQAGSIKRKGDIAVATVSGRDPFSDSQEQSPVKEKDDPVARVGAVSPSTEAKQQRQSEIQGWVNDWSVAADAMQRGSGVSRNTSHAESSNNNNWWTHSNLSDGSHSLSHSTGTRSDRSVSPEKSDRTGSNLSEHSAVSNSGSSIQRSLAGTISRNLSMRSASAGYALFAGAAAAIAGRVVGGGGKGEPEKEKIGVKRGSSGRSASLNFNSTSSEQQGKRRMERGETFSSARTSIGPVLHPGEGDALLSQNGSRGVAMVAEDYWATPPESPVKERYGAAGREGSFSQPAGRRAIGILGSVKRVFTGAGHVGVMNRVAEFESRSGQSSPAKKKEDMGDDDRPRRAVSVGASLLRGKRGAKDWLEEEGEGLDVPKVKRKPLPGYGALDLAASPGEFGHESEVNADEDEWDVEAAVERRVVQVMFTVPKEKLRVINADAVSVGSRSDVDFEGGEREGEVEGDTKRVSTVMEVDEEIRGEGDGTGTREEEGQRGKGNEVVR